MIVPLLCLITVILAEPPVGDGYASSRALDHSRFDQRSLSQSYGPPPLGTRNSPSTEYGPPSSRGSKKFGQRSRSSSVSRSYGAPVSQGSAKSISQDYGIPNARNEISLEYGTPNAGSISQTYGTPNARSVSEEYGTPDVRNSISQEYGLPDTRSISQEYGSPNSRSISEHYGPPGGYSGSARALSTEYSLPDARSTPSKDYGVPELAKNTQKSSHRSLQGFPQSKSAFSKHSKFGSRTQPQKSAFRSSSYTASLRNSDSYSERHNTNSPTYLPAQRDLSNMYGVPKEREISQEYGTPVNQFSLNTNAIASSYDAASSGRSSPSSNYGVPSARMPSDKYGVPDKNALSREALEQLLNQEPANYDFGYKVNDYESGSDFGHKETRLENRAEGSYFVVLPDGTKQTVEYEADEHGFKPRISVEQLDASALSGYDDNASGYDYNASDLARSGYDHASGYDKGSDLTRSGYDNGSGYDKGSDLTRSGYDENASDLAISDDGPY